MEDDGNYVLHNEFLIETVTESLRGGFFDRREKTPTKQSLIDFNELLRRRIELPPVVRFSSR